MRLPRYEDWAPTYFDAPGRGLGSSIDDGRAEWLVAPCILTRDSGALERTNWETITRSLCEADTGDDIELLNLWGRYGTEWTGSDGPHFDVAEAAAKVTRADALACGAVEVLP